MKQKICNKSATCAELVISSVLPKENVLLFVSNLRVKGQSVRWQKGKTDALCHISNKNQIDQLKPFCKIKHIVIHKLGILYHFPQIHTSFVIPSLHRKWKTDNWHHSILFMSKLVVFYLSNWRDAKCSSYITAVCKVCAQALGGH